MAEESFQNRNKRQRWRKPKVRHKHSFGSIERTSAAWNIDDGSSPPLAIISGLGKMVGARRKPALSHEPEDGWGQVESPPSPRPSPPGRGRSCCRVLTIGQRWIGVGSGVQCANGFGEFSPLAESQLGTTPHFAPPTPQNAERGKRSQRLDEIVRQTVRFSFKLHHRDGMGRKVIFCRVIVKNRLPVLLNGLDLVGHGRRIGLIQ